MHLCELGISAPFLKPDSFEPLTDEQIEEIDNFVFYEPKESFSDIPTVLQMVKLDPMGRRIEQILRYLLFLCIGLRSDKVAEKKMRNLLLVDVLKWRIGSKGFKSPKRCKGNYMADKTVVNFLHNTFENMLDSFDSYPPSVDSITERLNALDVNEDEQEYTSVLSSDSYYAEKIARTCQDLENIKAWMSSGREDAKALVGALKQCAGPSPSELTSLYTIIDDGDQEVARGATGVHAEMRILFYRKRQFEQNPPEVRQEPTGGRALGISYRCCAQCTLAMRTIPYAQLNGESFHYQIGGWSGRSFPNWGRHSDMDNPKVMLQFLGRDVFQLLEGFQAGSTQHQTAHFLMRNALLMTEEFLLSQRVQKRLDSSKSDLEHLFYPFDYCA